MLAIPPFWASSKNALLRANTKPPVELVVADLNKNEEHMYYLIKYEDSVESRVAIALTENPQNEIAVLALADYEDKTISIDEIYCILSEGQTDLTVKINMKIK